MAPRENAGRWTARDAGAAAQGAGRASVEPGRVYKGPRRRFQAKSVRNGKSRFPRGTSAAARAGGVLGAGAARQTWEEEFHYTMAGAPRRVAGEIRRPFLLAAISE